jgi:hypothetical protein
MNAKNEFVRHVNNRKVKCADIIHPQVDGKDCIKNFHLKFSFSEDDYLNFLNQLNFDYDEDYGRQELYGTIWYEDGTWSSRGEYDGLEWWEYHVMPEIPSYLEVA